jgi:hypothetical protein
MAIINLEDAKDAKSSKRLERLDVATKRAATIILAALHQLDRDLVGTDYEPGYPFEMTWVFMANEDEETAHLFRMTSHYED